MNGKTGEDSPPGKFFFSRALSVCLEKTVVPLGNQINGSLLALAIIANDLFPKFISGLFPKLGNKPHLSKEHGIFRSFRFHQMEC